MTRRTLNWKFLLITAMIGGATTAALYVLHGWQLSRTAQQLLLFAQQHERDAQETESKKEWLKAADYLDRYLRVKPADTQVKIRLAQTYAKGAEYDSQRERAIELHYRTLALGDKASETELRCRLAELMLELDPRSSVDRSIEAERQAKLVLKESPDHPQALRALALALNRQLANGAFAGQSMKALAALEILVTTERACKLNPDDLELAVLQSVLLRESPEVMQAERPSWTTAKRQQEADRNLDQFVTDHAQSSAARLARFRYRTKFGLPGASDDLDTALQLAPPKSSEENEILFTAAANALDQARRKLQSASDPGVIRSQFEESAGLFERLIPLLADHEFPHAHLGLGDARLGMQEIDRALAAWREGIVRARNFQASSQTIQADYYGRIVDACLANGRQADAAAALDEIDGILAKLGSTIPQVQLRIFEQGHQLRRARWHVQRRAYSAALPLLRAVLAQQDATEFGSQTAFQASYMLGSVYGEMGQWVEAATAFEQAATLQPTIAEAQLSAANAWLRAGRSDLARERAGKAQSVKPAQDVWFAVAGTELQFQRTRPPEDRDWSRFDEALAALTSSASGKPTAGAATIPAWRIAFLQAESAIAKAQPDIAGGLKRAAQALRTAEQQHATNVDFLRQLCLVYQGMDLNDEADRVLALIRDKEPQNLETTLVQARLMSMRGDDTNAAKVLQQAISSAAPAAADRLRSELLRAWLASKNWTEARGLLMQSLERDPRNMALLRRLAELDLERNDMPAVEKWEQRLREQGPVGESLARYFHAWRLFRSAKDAESPELRSALAELEKVALAQPNWAEAIALKGMTLQRLGRIEQAVADYERAVNNGDQRIFILEQLVALLDKLERPTDVEKYLARLESQAPLTQWATEFASTHEMRHERPGRALELARKRAEQQPDDATAQLWLGRLLVAANKSDEAKVALELATKLAPTNAQAWETLLTFYSRTNNQEQIRTTLEQLRTNDGLAASRKHLLIGRAYRSLGDLPAAERSLNQAVATDENNLATRLTVAQFFLQYDPARAVPHLDAALKIEPTSVAARQLLAIAHAAAGDLAAAESLLSALGEGQTPSAENTRLRALLLVQQGGDANLKRATRLIEDLVERNTRSQPVDRLLLARLCEQQVETAAEDSVNQQHLAKAEKHLTELAVVGDALPAHIAAAAHFFMRQGRMDEASKWLRKLESRVDALGSDDPSTIAMVIETQLQQRDTDRTPSWLARLQKLEPLSLRPAALQTRVAHSRDSKADIEAILEPQANHLLAEAATPQQRQQLCAMVGTLYRELNRLPSAERWFRQLLSESPQHFAALAGVLAAQKKMAEATDLCETAAQTDESAQPALVLATALVASSATESDFQRAHSLLNSAVKRFDTNQNLLYAVGLVDILRGANADAIPLLRKVVALNPRHVPALNNLALLLADVPEHRVEAIRMIEDAIRIAGPTAGLLDTKGSILVYVGRSAEAIEPLQAATRDPQADPRHHFHLAIAYFDTGRVADAKRHMQIALDRQIGSQVLTSTDREFLAKLLGNLNMEKPVSTTAVMR